MLPRCSEAAKQPGQGDLDKAPDGRLRPHPVGRGERVQAERGELGGRNVLAEIAGSCAVGDRCLDETLEMLSGVFDVLAPVEQGHQFRAVVYMREIRA